MRYSFSPFYLLSLIQKVLSLIGAITITATKHKIHTVKVSKLSLEEGEHTKEHVSPGSQEDNGNYYPVMVLPGADQESARSTLTAETGSTSAAKRAKLRW